MSNTADVIIIVAGIVGSSLAAELAKYFKNVVVLERDEIANYASTSNYGMVWLQTRFPGFDTMMARRSQEIYEEKIADGEFDIDIEYEKRGGLTIAFDDRQIEVMKKQCKEKQKGGTPMAVISREDTLRLEPALNPDIAGAIFCAEDARINPLVTTFAFANLARKRGATFVHGAEVVKILMSESGSKVIGVSTTKGDYYAPVVVNAAGVWCRQIGKMVGMDIPVFPNRLQSLVTEPVEKYTISRIVQCAREIEGDDMDPEKAMGFLFEITGEQTEENLPKDPVEDTIFTYVQQSLSGTIVIGTTNEFIGYDIRTTPKALYAMMKPAIKLFPVIRDANIIRTWASVIPFTYDGKPFVGPSGLEGFILACGHGHAIAHAPTAAEQIAQYLTKGTIDPLMAQASISRLKKK